MRSLQTAATGMHAQERNVEVISHNIANMRTTGYKQIRAEFQDLLYQDLRRVGSSSSQMAPRCRPACKSAMVSKPRPPHAS